MKNNSQPIIKGQGRLSFFNRLHGKILFSFGTLFVGTVLTIFLVFSCGIPFTNIKSLYEKVESKAFRDLEQISHMKKERLERWLKERRDDIRLFEKSELLANHIYELLESGTPVGNELNFIVPDGEKLQKKEVYKLLRQHLFQLKNVYGIYESIAIADMSGRIILSTNSEEIGVDVSSEDFFRIPLNNYGEVHQAIGIDVFGEGDRDLFVSQQLKSKVSEKRDVPMGVLIARTDSHDFIDPLLHFEGGLDHTGEAILFNNDGRILTPLKYPLSNGKQAVLLEYQLPSMYAKLAIHGEEGMMVAEDYRGESVLASFHYLRISSESGWGFIVKQDRSEVMAELDESMQLIFFVSLFSVFFLGLISFIIAKKLTHPIEELTKTSFEVEKGNFSSRALVVSRDETGILAKTFNKMLITIEEEIKERKQAEKSLIQQTKEIEELNRGLEVKIAEEVRKSRTKDFAMMQKARLASMGEMLGNIAHQWRQPLNGLGLIIQDLKEAQAENELDEKYLDTTVTQSMELIQFMSHTIDDFRRFFRKDDEKVRFNVLDVIRESLHLVHIQLIKKGITLVLQYEDKHFEVKSTECFDQIKHEQGKCFLVGYPNEFKQAILNLIMNSKDAILSTGIQTGKITTSLEKKDNSCCISIEDNGGGIPPEIIEKIFDPYFSNKEEGEGTGIGLYMSKIIIEEHMKGKITIINGTEGAKCTIMVNVDKS